MVSGDGLKAFVSQATSIAKALGVSVKDPTSDELEKIALSFNRQLILSFPQREAVDVFTRHQVEILLAGMVAKDQMSSTLDGEQPGSGLIGGPVLTRAGWLGIGDDWEDGGTAITTGTPQNWVHSGTTLLGGTPSNAIKIGENAVHVLLAMGSFHASPKLESIQNWIDDKPKPVLPTAYTKGMKMFGSIPLKELDSAILLYKDKNLLTKVFASAALGATVTDIPYFLGASFIKEPQLRIQDPVTFAATATARDVHKVVLTT